MTDSQIIIGKISGVYGVQGWLKIHSYTDPVVNVLAHQPWLVTLRGQATEIEIEAGRPHGKTIVVRLPGCSSREDAEQWIGAQISIDRSRLPAPREREYYWLDLVNCEVITTQGEKLGRVTQMMETGANDVLVVSGDRERLIPFIMDQVILQVDIAQSSIVVEWDSSF